MAYNVGKIVSFDGNYGEIVSKLGKYIFLAKDLEIDSEIKIGTIVAFRNEIINNEPRAFFIKELDKLFNSEMQDYQNARLTKKNNG